MLWSGSVSADSPLSMEAQFDLRITGACLGQKVKEGERVFLIMTHEDFVAEEPRTSPVCVLTAGTNENQYLDLVLDEGEPVSFAVHGSATVHLTGYFVIEDDGDDRAEQMIEYSGMFEDESDDDSFQPDSMDAMDSASEDDSSNEEPKVEEIDDSILQAARAKVESKKRKMLPEQATPPPSKKQKTRETPSPMKDSPQKKNETPQKKTETPQKKKETPQKSPQQKSPQQTRVQKLRGGTVAEILTPGKGSATASKGQKVTVKYEGKLAKNGKKFDSGKFSFKLGKGEVIKGMDTGVEGMLLNEKRKITIPANQAYGNQRAGDIPPKSDLVFTVTLLGMK